MPAAISLLSSSPGTTPQIRNPADAAKAFETLMLQQLMGSMSKTVGNSGLFNNGFEGKLYGEMFVSAIAEKAAGGNLGLTEMIQEALGVDERLVGELKSFTSAIRGISAYRAAVSGAAEPPANGFLAQVAEGWLDRGQPSKWGKEGALTEHDLAADLVTNGVGGPAVFNVRDASGYEGHPKCNLFAFEMLRRAGYSVPVRPRSHGWGYPGADTVAKWSEKGDTGAWAQVRTSASAEALDALARSGTPLLLSSSAPESRAGHMAVADRIHSIQRDQDGRIAVLEYSGWDAGSKKAGYGRKVWRLASIPGQGRGGLDRIEVLEPAQAAQAGSLHRIGSERPGASVHDLPRETTMPAQGSARGTD